MSLRFINFELLTTSLQQGSSSSSSILESSLHSGYSSATLACSSQVAPSTQRTASTMTFGVNVVAYYVLISKVLPKLQSPGRIIIVDNGVQFGDFKHTFGTTPAPLSPEGNLDQALNPGKGLDDPNTARAGYRAYSTSKLGVICLVHELARPLNCIKVMTYNPGLVVGTGHLRDASLFMFSYGRRFVAYTPLAIVPKDADKFSRKQL
ncbi:hypothetical protein POJ06DRAFT_59084 [Lipomyces tetrasporus]|uniref:Uncharacterized protein n=1 Tax=Lipomyces tetrasporus TaxID=54092 RepID=A0AAD7VUW3_9ASCO|nr:uncharacterized protein POJ06DRAFT_59084 [Lipomyces tetrasporus]KAJ8102923.1 hypothetical protein POJ06DRAFT_59084 [Lipomyces tetrasporus]